MNPKTDELEVNKIEVAIIPNWLRVKPIISKPRNSGVISKLQIKPAENVITIPSLLEKYNGCVELFCLNLA